MDSSWVGLFYPSCSTPVYAQPNVETAAECGRYSGYLTAGVVTFFVVVFVLIYAWIVAARSSSDPKYSPYLSTAAAVVIGVLVCIIAYLALPGLTSYLYRQQWLGYDTRISNYMNQGMTRAAAINELNADSRAYLNYQGQQGIANSLRQMPAPRPNAPAVRVNQ
jgi:heme/copper-type cytochrome/quinol oxidase subunit 2